MNSHVLGDPPKHLRPVTDGCVYVLHLHPLWGWVREFQANSYRLTEWSVISW